MKPKFNPGQLDMFVPVSTWIPPTTLPDWRGARLLAIDTETKDMGLSADLGPGWAFKNHGHILGVSVCVEDIDPIYVPMRHPDTDNVDVNRVVNWLNDLILSAGSVVFHNMSYDTGWLESDLNIPIHPGPVYHDTYAMAVMLDENRNSYSLDSCCKWYGVPSKDERMLRESAIALGCDPKSDMWRMPARYVGPYAEQDAASTLDLACKSIPQITEQNLEKAYRLEMDLIPLSNMMRRRGMRVDLDRCAVVGQRFDVQCKEALAEIKWHLKQRRDVTIDDLHSPAWLEMVFDDQGIEYPRTPKTKRGQFQADWLETLDHWLPKSIVKARKFHDSVDKFITQYIIDHTIDGKIHAEIHQLRDDTGGTRSYRYSYSNPPLQQTPSRDPELGPYIRSCFVPEPGEEWLSMDLKAQEPRLTVHYAHEYKTIGSQKAVDYYNNDPNPDYHSMVAELTGLPRKEAKIINLGVAYGMGVDKLAQSLRVSSDQAQIILNQYNSRLPFISHLTKILSHEASTKGYITLLDGARCRFDSWEPAGYRMESQVPAPTLKTAQYRWPGRQLKRYGTHKALNRKIQGGSARQVKMIMRECARQGYIPLISMHDEINWSINDRRVIPIIQDLMVNTVKLHVPSAVDIEVGSNWGMMND
jgi:DNA polymerase I-like protein with 3'-5' exonuclease and polymerase domains